MFTKKTKKKLKNTYNSAPTTILCVVGGKLSAKTKVYKYLNKGFNKWLSNWKKILLND